MTSQRQHKRHDINRQIALQPAIKFNGGGHTNHGLFWQDLAPASSSDARPQAAKRLSTQIDKTWGSLDSCKQEFATTLLSLQCSG